MPYKDKEKRREYQKEYMRKWYEKNKAKHIAYVRNRDKKIKLWVKEYKETLKCENCEENHPACLEFHQTSRPVKTASVTQVRQPLYRKSLARWKNYEPTLGDLFARIT